MTSRTRDASNIYANPDSASRINSDPLNLSEYMAPGPISNQLAHPTQSPPTMAVPATRGATSRLSAFAEFPTPYSGAASGQNLAVAYSTDASRQQGKPLGSSFDAAGLVHDGFGANGGPRRTSAAGVDSRAEDLAMHAMSDDDIDHDFDERRSSKDGGPEFLPSWSEMKTKAGKERKRLPLACIACRRKKIRCSGEKPACKHCLRSRIPCVYKVTTRKAAPRTDYMAMLDKRLKRMEDRVIRLVPKDGQAAIASVPRAVVKPALPPPPAKASNGKKRPAEEAFGEQEPDLEEWARNKQTAKSLHPTLMTAGPDADDTRLLTEGADALPSKEIQHHLAEIYFEYVYGQAYPLLHKPSFMRKLAAGTVPPVLTLAVCAISARFSTHPQLRSEPAFLRGEEWASVAREISLKRYDTPNITILIVYILLGLHEFGTCQGGRSWMFGGMAARMAFALQLHRDLDHDLWSKNKKDHPVLTPIDREIRRRTMWATFLMDRFNSSGSERPVSMREEYINVPLPIKESLFQMETPGTGEIGAGKVLQQAEGGFGRAVHFREHMGTSACVIRLISMWGRIVRYWNFGGREQEKYPMWSTLSEFHNLKESLRNYQATLPEALRYNRDNLETHASEKIANQFVFMHIIYHQLNLFMHRFALPFSGYGRPSKEMPPQFHTESARTALEAANQVSALINEAIDYSVTAPFAGYCAFYSSTVHIHGIFSKNPKLEAKAKQNLAINVRYLTKMKKYWGMFHFVAENLKDLYRQHADVALRGPGAAGSEADHIFQYGDWFDRYPHGVSQTHFEEAADKPKQEPGTDAALGQKSDHQSVEDFFATLSPPEEASQKKARPSRRSATNTRPVDQKVTVAPPFRRSSTGMSQPSPMGASATRASPVVGDGFMGFDTNTVNPYLDQSYPYLFQPGMLSELDRQMVLSSYVSMDPLGPANNAMGGAQQQQQQQQQHPAASSASPPNPANASEPWGSSYGGMPPVPAGFQNYMDRSTAWFTPFNLNPPPADAMEDGMMGGGLPYGFGPDVSVADGFGADLGMGHMNDGTRGP